MIDNNFTIKMKRWLEAEEHTERADIMEGAMMLLQLTRNQALFNTISRRPEKYVKKIEYELKKFLPMRLARMTMNDVKNLDEEISPIIKVAIDEEPEDNEGKDIEELSLPARGGKREDHDSLPEDIKAIWAKNAERWKKIKAAYNTLLTLSEPCDRYEHLVTLKELWYAYKADFDRYDSFTDAPTDDNTDEENTTAVVPATVGKEIGNARSYISKNIDKYIELKKASANDDSAVEKATALYKKMCERISLLVKYNEIIGDDLKAKLEGAGFIVPYAPTQE